MNGRKKVNILPCSGIGKTLGTLSRWTAFEIVEHLCPKKTQLLCLARAVVGDNEIQSKILDNYNITLDGCPKQCAKKNIELKGGDVQKSYLMARFLIKNRDLIYDKKNVIDPGDGALELAKRIALQIRPVIDKIFDQGGAI